MKRTDVQTARPLPAYAARRPRFPGTSVMLLLCAISAGCADAPPPTDDAPLTSAAAAPIDSASLRADSVASVARATLPDTLKPISERVVIYIEATPAEIGAVAAEYSEEDFAIVADDMMWYRAMAYEWLEKQKLPIRRMEGRRPLEFVVQGVVKRYDLSGVIPLELIILYDKDREPKIIAPNEVGETVTNYFANVVEG
jgi:hypothetical protein